MNSPHFSLQDVKQMDLVEYLEKLGYQPQKIMNKATGIYHNYWKRNNLLIKSTEH